MTRRTNVIVAGAGCAGLAMARCLMRVAPADWRITVIDPTLSEPPNKTWCFWGSVPSVARSSVAQSWWQMRVAFPGWDRVERLHRNPYHCIRASTYHRHLREELLRDPRVTLIEDRVVRIEELGEGRGAVVELPERAFLARWVFQSCSRPAVRNLGGVVQQFGGWEIETDRPYFDDTRFTLMDFDTEQADWTRFFYVLPISRRRALVEHTTFTARPVSRHVHQATDGALVKAFIDRSVTAPWRRVREEYGTIPMSSVPYDQQRSASVFNIGAAGGMTKASTGYTFARTQRQVAHMANTVVREGRPHLLPEPPSRFRFYDGMLLRVLAREPQRGREVFDRLFRHNTFDDVFSFLDEETRLADELSMLGGLPWAPFLRELLMRPESSHAPALPELAVRCGR